MREQELTEALSEIIFQMHETNIDPFQRATIYEIIIGCFNNEGLIPDDMAVCKGIDEAFDEVWEEMYGETEIDEAIVEELEE